jgi:predicted AAA+ superfamily ATPase
MLLTCGPDAQKGARLTRALEAKMKKNPDRNSTHLAGEYFVAAELYRLGYNVGMTIGNAKAIDILVEKGGHTIAVQLKAIRDKKSVGWPMMKDQLNSRVIYVFVLLNKSGANPIISLRPRKRHGRG